MTKKLKLLVSILVIVLLIINVSVLFSACNDTEIEPGFYTLQEAYKLGIINKKELKSIAYYHNMKYHNESFMEEGFEPIPLDAADKYYFDYIGGRMQLTYAYAELLSKTDGDVTSFDVTTYEYYGTYNGAMVAFVRHELDEPRHTEIIDTIDGVPIHYTTLLP